METVRNFEFVAYNLEHLKSAHIKICDKYFVIKLYNYSRVALIASLYVLKCLKDITFLSF
jgi:hypothetical protein